MVCKMLYMLNNWIKPLRPNKCLGCLVGRATLSTKKNSSFQHLNLHYGDNSQISQSSYDNLQNGRKVKQKIRAAQIRRAKQY